VNYLLPLTERLPDASVDRSLFSEEGCHCWIGLECVDDADLKLDVLFKHTYQDLMHNMGLGMQFQRRCQELMHNMGLGMQFQRRCQELMHNMGLGMQFQRRCQELMHYVLSVRWTFGWYENGLNKQQVKTARKDWLRVF
jgi:hypothetical protein